MVPTLTIYGRITMRSPALKAVDVTVSVASQAPRAAGAMAVATPRRLSLKAACSDVVYWASLHSKPALEEAFEVSPQMLNTGFAATVTAALMGTVIHLATEPPAVNVC